jgi:AraC-like DNA-binding protein
VTMDERSRYAPDFLIPVLAGYDAGLDAELHEVAVTAPERVSYELTQVVAHPPVSSAPRWQPPRILLDALDRGEQYLTQTLASQLHQFWETVIAPYWPRMRGRLEEDIGYRATHLARSGFASMIASIDPRFAWRGGALGLPSREFADVPAQAVIFTPSPFGQKNLYTIDLPGVPGRRPPMICYPALAPAGHRRQAASSLLRQIHAFIDQNLTDPDLTPAAVAAAVHISPRYLYQLLARQKVAAAALIRDRRLQACREDLADPAMREYPVSAIAARWGFSSAAHFSRVFRGVYGITPGQYRLLSLRQETR